MVVFIENLKVLSHLLVRLLSQSKICYFWVIHYLVCFVLSLCIIKQTKQQKKSWLTGMQC